LNRKPAFAGERLAKRHFKQRSDSLARIPRRMGMLKRLAFLSVVVGAVAAPSMAGVTVSTLADGPSYPAGFVLTSSATPQATMTVNQQPAGGNSLTQTFKTGASSLPLDKIVIYSGGKAGGNVRLNIYPDPVGGENTDGFVNTSFSTDLLGGGAGVTVAVSGSPGTQYIVFDLTGTDEITLAANQQYAIEFDVLDGAFSWQRSAAAGYADGNIYAGATEGSFNGTPPADNRGQRFQVGGSPDRDGGFALYAVPEPSSMALLAFGGVALLNRRSRR
jgi:hypothetical protein